MSADLTEILKCEQSEIKIRKYNLEASIESNDKNALNIFGFWQTNLHTNFLWDGVIWSLRDTLNFIQKAFQYLEISPHIYS